MTLAFIDGIGGPELLLIFLIILVLFGGKGLPEMARGLARSLKEFKKAASGVEEEFRKAMHSAEPSVRPPPAARPAHRSIERAPPDPSPVPPGPVPAPPPPPPPDGPSPAP